MPRVLTWRPGTGNRVETLLTHRKPSIEYRSTRNVPVHRSFRHSFAKPAARRVVFSDDNATRARRFA